MDALLKSHLGIILLVVVFVVLGVLRLNDLSFYTPDSCRYLVWGNSLAHGKGFVDDTQPVPERFVINAPLYAVLISPVEVLFPLSVVAVKVWTLLMAAMAILLFYRWLCRIFGRNEALFGSIIFAFNPVILFLSTEVLSEAPFLGAIMFSMLLVEWGEGTGYSGKKYFIFLLLCGSCSLLLRETGAAIVGALVVFFLVRRRTWRAVSILAVSLFFYGCWYLRNSHWMSIEGRELRNNLSLVTKHFVTPETSALPVEIGRRLWLSLQSYAMDLGGRLFFPLSSSQLTGMFRVNASDMYAIVSSVVNRMEFIIVIVATLLMLAGFVRDFRRSPTFWLRFCFILFYVVIIGIYPVRDIRFLVPLLPFMIYYTIGGMRWCIDVRKIFPRIPKGIAFAMVMIFMLPNFLGIQQLIALNIDYNRYPDELNKFSGLPIIYRYQWQKVGDWIRANVPESCVIASPVKDLVVVSGGRKVLEIDPGETLPSFENLLRDYQVEYLFASARWSDLRDYEFLMRESRRFWFEPIGAVPNLMKVHSRFLQPHMTVTPHNDFDTSRTSELLRLGRFRLIHGEYEAASKILSRALDRAPTQVAVLYQLLVAAMMSVDTAAVPRLYEKLLQVPQSLSYSEMARAQWDAYHLLVESGTIPQTGRSLALRSEAARKYWDLGYFQRAAELLDVCLNEYSNNFSMVVQGLYYNLQNGDTSKAREFFSRLRSLDGSNVIVQSFDTIFTLNDSLPFVDAGWKKSDYHLTEAAVYSSLGFKTEGIDEAERSLFENPLNIRTLEFLAREYAARRNYLRASRLIASILAIEPKNHFALSMVDSLEGKR
jgi:tetratricopeptide (TPR) repeat protein/4-amino-4-deoxy-L-arabinose transferase-like glycosyltransferase